jgi:hypothetical protein
MFKQLGEKMKKNGLLLIALFPFHNACAPHGHPDKSF